jgi:hypothetical protein
MNLPLSTTYVRRIQYITRDLEKNKKPILVKFARNLGSQWGAQVSKKIGPDDH